MYSIMGIKNIQLVIMILLLYKISILSAVWSRSEASDYEDDPIDHEILEALNAQKLESGGDEGREHYILLDLDYKRI